MRSKRPKQLSELHRAQLLEQSRTFCRLLNSMTASVAATSVDYLAILELNRAVLATIKTVTGDDAPWVRLVSGASYPDDSTG